MRTLAASTQTERAKVLGSAPIAILEIDWGGAVGVKYYADWEFSKDGNSVQNRIKSISAISSAVDADRKAEISTFNVDLSDTDLTLKGYIDGNDIEQAEAKVYLYYYDEDWADKATIFEGVITAPIIYDEHNLTLKLNFTNHIIGDRIGVKIDETDYEDETDTYTLISDGLWDKVWPVCFGKPINVPCVSIYYPRTAKVEEKFDESSNIIKIEEGHKLPAGGSSEPITLCIEGMFVKGYFTVSGDPDFVVTEMNQEKYDNTNPTIQAHTPTTNYREMKINNGYLPGNWVVVQNGSNYALNYCIGQDSDKVCYFAWNWCYWTAFASKTGYKPNLFNPSGSHTIYEVRRHHDSGWANLSGIDDDYINPTFKVSSGKTAYLMVNSRHAGGNMTFPAVEFIANQYSSDDILSVYVDRQFPHIVDKSFVKIPDSRYIWTNDERFGYSGVTVIQFIEPLFLVPEEQWEDSKIWATVDAAVGSNTADQIEWIINNYTGYTPDSTTFSAVQSSLTKYPSNFAILKQMDSIKAIKDIAWQARCGLTFKDDKVYIKYLSQEPTKDLDLDDEDIEANSLSIVQSESTELYTAISASFRYDYYYPEITVTLYNQAATYGHNEKEFKLWIYNIYDCVAKSANFWKERLSRTWQKISGKTFLKLLEAEPLDCIEVQLNECDLFASGNARKAIVESTSFDLNDFSMTIKLWTCVEAGTTTQSSDAWASDSDDSTPTDPASTISERTKIVYTKLDIDEEVFGTGP